MSSLVTSKGARSKCHPQRWFMPTCCGVYHLWVANTYHVVQRLVRNPGSNVMLTTCAVACMLHLLVNLLIPLVTPLQLLYVSTSGACTVCITGRYALATDAKVGSQQSHQPTPLADLSCAAWLCF